MTNEFDDIKALYQQKKCTDTSSLHEMKSEGEGQLKKLKKIQLKTVFIFLITAGVIIYADVVSSEKFNTSVPGFWILLGCSLYYAATKLYLFRKLHSIDPGLPALTVIGQLEGYEKQNTFLQTYAQFIYVIILSIGVYLYLLPLIEFMSDRISPKSLKFLKWIWFAYLAWVFVHTFFIRRKRLQAESTVLEGYIHSLRSVS